MFRTYINTIHDGMTTEQTVWIIYNRVAAIGNKTVSIQQTGRTDELIWIPPERRTRSRTAGAQNTFVQAIQFFTLFLTLQTLFMRINRSVVYHIRLD